MREQLAQYVSLLFAGTTDCDDVHQEILQNTLERYDDLIAQGKTPEAAYRLAIAGIGDIQEILGARESPDYSQASRSVHSGDTEGGGDTPVKKVLRTIAIALYILCPVPILVLDELGMDTLGICGLLTFVAAATVLMILGKKTGPEPQRPRQESQESYINPGKELRRSVRSLVWAVGLALYFIVSFATGAWYVTWVIFLIIPAVQGLVIACMDLLGGN